MRKNKKKAKNNLILINSMTLSLGLQLGLASYILSTFLQKQVGDRSVGWFFLLGYLISFFVLINLYKLIRECGRAQTLFIFVGIRWASLIGMGIFWYHPISVVFAVFSLVGSSMLWATLDVLVESYSDDKTTGKTRGLFLTILNLGFLSAPFVSTWLVQNFENGFQLVFYAAAFFTLIPLIILALFFQERKYGIARRRKNFSVVRELLKRKDVLRIYSVSFLLDLFYSVMVVYTPVYLLSIGLGWIEIGKIFTVMLIPFVVLQYPLGVLADRKTGEKEWLIGALAVMSIATIAIGFIKVPNVGIWMSVLLLTRVGAATVEVMRDTYFYKQIGPKDIELMDFYRTTRNLAYVVGMTVSSLLLMFLSLNDIFIVLGLVVGVGIIPLFKLKDTKISR